MNFVKDPLSSSLGRNADRWLFQQGDHATDREPARGGRVGPALDAMKLHYDNANRLTTILHNGTKTYTWDARNRLVSISGGVTASFAYDALGRRLSKTINGVTTQYLYDGNDIVQEFNGGAVTATYLRSLNIDEPFIRQTGTGEFYHTDALGSTVVLSNVSGAPATTYSYEAFGNTTSTETSSNPFQFTGRENDGIGLYYYRARYYSSMTGRFLSEDRVNRNGAINLYTYVRNNPLRWIDPFGLWTYAREYGTTGAGLTENITGIENAVDRVFNGIANRDAVVTYSTNGAHRADSLHYSGNAIDLRTRDLSPSQRRDAADRLRRTLPTGYDVIDEGDHIHIEYDPVPVGGDAGGGGGEGSGGGPAQGSGGAATGGMGGRK